MNIASTVAGIPCLVHVDYCLVVKGNSRADNPDDYYGYTEVEFTVLDRRGREAPWLEKKLSDEDTHRIKNEILENRNDDY